MADSPQKIIAAQAREIEKLKAARNVPNTAAADMAGILNISNTSLQSSKEELETRLSEVTLRNTFLETELSNAANLFKQTIPGEQGHRDHITRLAREINNLNFQNNNILVKNQTLVQQTLNQQQKIQQYESDQAILLTEHSALTTFCKQWSEYSGRQLAEIEALKAQGQSLHESIVRKSWRLHVQKSYLDKAGLVVTEFEQTNDWLAAKKWAAEVLDEPLVTGGLPAEPKSGEQDTREDTARPGADTQDAEVGKPDDADGMSVETEGREQGKPGDAGGREIGSMNCEPASGGEVSE